MKERGVEALGFTEEQLRRYSRNMVLPGWGEEGQRKLWQAKVLVVGTGGLGSPALLYLAGAGIGTLGVVDFDTVDVSNLPRQILHYNSDVGRPKVQSAMETIRANNPDVTLVPHETRLTASNARGIIEGYDMVVAAVDNFPARYLINDACVLLGKPMIEASILYYEGQATTFLPGQGCYRCLYPSMPAEGAIPTPAEAGVMSIAPAILGSIQASEAIKLALGIGQTLAGRLLLLDVLNMQFREVRIHKDPACPVCGDNPSIRELRDER